MLAAFNVSLLLHCPAPAVSLLPPAPASCVPLPSASCSCLLLLPPASCSCLLLLPPAPASCVLPLPSASCSSSSVSRLKAVTNPRFGQDVFGISGVSLDLLSQLSDKDAEVFGLFGVIASPDRSEQLVMREHRTRVLDQIDQQIELL